MSAEEEEREERETSMNQAMQGKLRVFSSRSYQQAMGAFLYIGGVYLPTASARLAHSGFKDGSQRLGPTMPWVLGVTAQMLRIWLAAWLRSSCSNGVAIGKHVKQQTYRLGGS